MLLAMCLILLAVLLHLTAARIAARENFGRRLPAVYGSNPVRPAQRARRAQTAGWLLSIIGAFRVGDHFWLTTPWVALSMAVTILVLVNGLPGLIVAAIHNGRLRIQSES